MIELVDYYETTDKKVKVEVHNAPLSDPPFWVKIKHIGSDPKIGELNFTGERVIALCELLMNIIDKNNLVKTKR